jgi:hypothetical protein
LWKKQSNQEVEEAYRNACAPGKPTMLESICVNCEEEEEEEEEDACVKRSVCVLVGMVSRVSSV